MKKESSILITTTSTIEGKKIEYLGMVSGQVVSGINLFKDIFAIFRNIVGGRAKSYEIEMETAKGNALKEMIKQAQEMGANAIIAVDIDFEAMGANNGMLMVVATGTAVKLR